MSTFPYRLTALTLACFTASFAHAAEEQSHVLETVKVQSSADASKEGLSEAYAGGQVAEGGSLGILGKQDSLETPYNFTNYTELLIEDQQAESVGDVLLNDPAVRVARGFGNFQQVYLVRGLPVGGTEAGTPMRSSLGDAGAGCGGAAPRNVFFV